MRDAYWDADPWDLQEDYARFVFRGDVEPVMARVNQATTALEVLQGDSDIWPGDCKSWGVPPAHGKPAGRVWECWGPVTFCITRLPFGSFAPKLNRLDVRMTVPDLDALGLDVMWATFRAAGKARTVHRYSSPARSKRNGRDAGGDTLAVGSHKSDVRVSWYIRKGESGAIEVQCQGDVLKNIVAVIMTGYEGMTWHSTDMWRDLKTMVWQAGLSRVGDLCGEPFSVLMADAINARADALLNRAMMPDAGDEG